MQEITNMGELYLRKVIRENEEAAEKLQETNAKHKLLYDNYVMKAQETISNLQKELIDREDCIYKLNRQCFTYQLERAKKEKIHDDLSVFELQGTIDAQQKEIQSLKSELNQKKTKVSNLEQVLLYQEQELRKTA